MYSLFAAFFQTDTALEKGDLEISGPSILSLMKERKAQSHISSFN